MDKGLSVSVLLLVTLCRTGFGLLVSELSADPVQSVNVIIIINRNINILRNSSLLEGPYEAIYISSTT
jgi:hypothetical protein